MQFTQDSVNKRPLKIPLLKRTSHSTNNVLGLVKGETVTTVYAAGSYELIHFLKKKIEFCACLSNGGDIIDKNLLSSCCPSNYIRCSTSRNN